MNDMPTARDPLTELADDARRLFAAGVSAGDGGALRRHAEAVRRLGARVPALAPLADAIDRTCAAAEKQRAAAVLDLNLLLRRVRAGLATAGVGGTPEPVDPSGPWTTELRLDEPVFTDLLPELADPKARPLNALILADHEEMGTELRLVGPLLAGLEHPDKDAPQRIASVLPRFGNAVAGELRRDFHPAGDRADAMRLRALGRIDPEAARAACREALDRGSQVVRAEAMELLPKIDPAEAERHALALLRAPSTPAETRKLALKSLHVARGDAGLEMLLSAIDAPDSLWSAAAMALQESAHPGAGAGLFESLRAALAEGQEAGLRRAMRLMPVLIRRRHPEALRLFLSWLDHPNKELRAWARNWIRHLYESGDAVVPELVAALGHKDPPVLVGVMDSLLRCGGAAADATPRLAELLQHRQVGLREKAATTLGAVGAGRPDAVAALVAALRDESAKVRHAAAEALARFGPAAAAAVPALTEALNDRQAEVCSGAVRALGQIGAAAAGTVPAVLALQEHEFASVRYQAVMALPRLGEPGVAEVVRRLREPGRHAYLIGALSRCGGVDPAIVRELVAILRDRSHPERAAAAAALGDFRPAPEPTVAALVEALDEDDDALREAAAKALVILTINAKDAVIPLAGVAVPALTRAVRNGTYRTRVDACRALEKLAAAAAPALPALTDAVNDPDFIVRQCARAALRAILLAE
jgi:HEAT repeat protein